MIPILLPGDSEDKVPNPQPRPDRPDRPAEELLLSSYEAQLEAAESEINTLTQRAENLRFAIRGLRGLLGAPVKPERASGLSSLPVKSDIASSERPKPRRTYAPGDGKGTVLWALGEVGTPATAEEVLQTMVALDVGPDSNDPLQTVRIHLGRAVASGEAMRFSGRRFGLPAWAVGESDLFSEAGVKSS